ncbi:interferon lambda receptor 1-like [Carcharodon carcharias]|uniref:interferon lambda receptor 1-like n=1 Tax=Carcharodon carcharias TaxID=13397 RepID=UPI001B7E3BCD|nr:interferon lambda receptor 1-like [Carcharodon carcharias]
MAAPWHEGGSKFPYLLIIHVLGNVLMSSQNVTLSSKNFSLFLTWTPPVEHSPETLYKVEIKPEDVWFQPANCTFPSEEGCDVTCTIKNCYTRYQARVRSILPETAVIWKQSNVFTPFYDVELGAPQVKVVLGEESVTMHLRFNLAPCKEKVLEACLLKKLTYELKIWDKDEHIKRPIKQSLIKNSVEIQRSELRGNNNCISARSIDKSLLKYSNFSTPYCFSLKSKELQTEKYLAIMGSMLGVFILISITVAIVKKIAWVTSSVKMPAALDFTTSTIFTQKLADTQPDVCKLSIITYCDKNETEMYEQNIALERNLVKETNFLDNADCTDESDEENECCDYTDRRWIPDGVMLDKDEMLDNDQHQALIAEGYQKANCSFDSTIGAVDLQSQESDCTKHNRPQTKSNIDVSNPISFTSDILNSKCSSDCINSVLDHDEQSSNADIPLMSVKVLCCNDDDNYDDVGDDEEDDLLTNNVPLCDLNFQTCDLTYRFSTLLPGEYGN